MLYCNFRIFVFEDMRFMFNFMRNIKICKFSSFTLFCRILFFSRCSCILRTNTLSQALRLKWLRVAYQLIFKPLHQIFMTQSNSGHFKYSTPMTQGFPLILPRVLVVQEDYSRSHLPARLLDRLYVLILELTMMHS